MLFQIDYRVFEANRGDALRAFGSFTQEQLESLLADHGVTLVGRWHSLGAPNSNSHGLKYATQQ